MKKSVLYLSSILLIVVLNSCKHDTAQGDWIKGNEKEKLEKIEWQFRGFDKAMVEVGYRYQELYWAGKDENWGYADYLTKKIEKAIKTGLQRRPKRAKSAQTFLNHTLPDMQKAVNSKNIDVFNNSFVVMTKSCNDCHVMEKLPFFYVKPPQFRSSSIKK